MIEKNLSVANQESKKIIFQIVVICCILTFGITIQFYINSLIGKALGPKTFGYYSVTMNLLLLFGQTMLFGLDTLTLKYLPPMLKYRQLEQAKSFIQAVLKFIFLITLYCFIGGSIIALVHYIMLKDKKAILHYASVSLFYLEFIGIISFYNLIIAIIKAIGKPIALTLIFLFRDLLFLALILFSYKISLDLAILSAITSYFVLLLIGLLIIAYSCFRVIASEKFNLTLLFKESRIFWFEALISSWWFAILLFIIQVLPRTQHEVGILASLFSITYLTMIPMIVLRIVFQAYMANKMDQSKAVIKLSLNFALILATVLMIAFIIIIYLISPYLLSLYGDEYHIDHFTIIMATIIYFPNVLALGNNSYLNYHEKGIFYLTWLLLVALIILLISGFGLIWLDGPLGALYSYAITQLFSSLGTFILARYLLNQQ